MCTAAKVGLALQHTKRVGEHGVGDDSIFFRTKAEMIQMWTNIIVRDFTMNIHHQITFRQSNMRGYEGAGEPTVMKHLTKKTHTKF